MKLLFFCSVLLCTVLFASCSKGLSGAYAGQLPILGGDSTLEFESGSKALWSVGRSKMIEYEYKVQDNKIIFDKPVYGTGNVLTIEKDGSLTIIEPFSGTTLTLRKT